MAAPDIEGILSLFEPVQFTQDGIAKVKAINKSFRNLVEDLIEITELSAEQVVMFDKLQEAKFWAQRTITDTKGLI